MPSAAMTALDNALVDVNNLFWFHESSGGVRRGKRPAQFQSLNKSAAVLLCAAWEIYIETVIMECVALNIAAANEPADMLRSLQKLTQIHIREGRAENAWLSVAGQGWKELTRSLAQARVAALNTPKPGPITELAKSVLGVEDIKDNWCWLKNPLGTPADKLKEFVSLRGSIAHGEPLQAGLTKARVKADYELIQRLSNCVETKLQTIGLLA